MNNFDYKFIELEQLVSEYINLKISDSIDYSKFYLYSIISHSTQIEGSTLSELETQLLFDEGTTTNGKPLLFHNMNIDLKNAYDFAFDCAVKKESISIDLIKKFSSLIMNKTGVEWNSISGSWDSSKGDFRLHGVTAGIDGKSYLNYTKIPKAMDIFVNRIIDEEAKIKTIRDAYELSWNAHLDLLTIHPFGDGNGRVSRLLMNYIQLKHGVVLTKLKVENKREYIETLKEAQDKNNVIPYKEFMLNQQINLIQNEINRFKSDMDSTMNFSL